MNTEQPERFTTPLKSVKQPKDVNRWLDTGKNITIGVLLIIIGWAIVPILYKRLKPITPEVVVPIPEVTKSPDVMLPTPEGGVLITKDTPLPPLNTEVFIREEGTNDESKELVQAHGDLRAMAEQLEEAKAEIAHNRAALNAITVAINNGSLGGSTGGGMTEEKVKGIARGQVAYYWRNHDDVAKKRGYRNVIKFEDVNY